jgi:hypothetical protein
MIAEYHRPPSNSMSAHAATSHAQGAVANPRASIRVSAPVYVTGDELVLDTHKRWTQNGKADYKNARIGNKFFVAMVLDEPSRHIVTSTFGGVSREAVVGQTTLVIPTGQVLQISSFSPPLVGTPENIDDEHSFRMKVC